MDSGKASSGVLAEALSTLRPGPADRHGPLAPMMLALTFVTGLVDATSYLRLGHVFVANMTGNVVLLGFGLAGAAGISVLSSLVAIAAFVIGAGLGGALAGRSSAHRGRRLRAACAAQALLIALALIVSLIASSPLATAARYELIVPLAMAMGVQNATAQTLAIPELTTTVLTKTLTGIASEAGLLGGPGAQFGRRSVAVATMLAGALAGGLLVLDVSVAASLGLAGALVVCVGAAAHMLGRGDPGWTRT